MRSRSAPLSLSLFLLLACHHHQPAPQSPAAALLGTWQYRSGMARDTTRPSLNAGLQFALTFDSVGGQRAFGQVTQWFAGDVGALPGTFGRVVATMDSAGTVAMVVPYARGGAEPMQFLLALHGDTLTIVHGSESFQTTAGAKFVRARP
jgi:hypothetical protein